MFSLILQGFYGALRPALCIFINFTRALRSSTVGLVCFHSLYKGSTELYGRPFVFPLILREFYGGLRVVLCVFVDFTSVLRSSTAGAVYFHCFYGDSTELYGWASVFSLILEGFYGALLQAPCISIDFTRVLRSSTGELVILQRFYGALRPALCISLVLHGFYGALRVGL